MRRSGLISDKILAQARQFDAEVNKGFSQWLEKSYQQTATISVEKTVDSDAEDIKALLGAKVLRIDIPVSNANSAIVFLGPSDYTSDLVNYLEQSGEGAPAVPASMQTLLDAGEQISSLMREVLTVRYKNDAQLGNPTILLWNGNNEAFLQGALATYFSISIGLGLTFPVIRIIPNKIATEWFGANLSNPIAAEKKVFGEFKQNEAESKNLRPIEELLDLELEVGVELGRVSMLLRDVLELGPGGIIELDKFAGDPVDLYVNKKKFAEGEVVVVEQNFAVRITNLVSAQDRISSARNVR